MAQDPKTVRFNSASDPDRLRKFEAALDRAAADGGEVLRHLADAYIRYVREHGHNPAFPVKLVPIPYEDAERGKKPKG